MALNGSTEQLFAEARSSCLGLIECLARSHEADPWLRRELVQDILLAVWAALPGFRGEASIATFTLAIARRKCLAHVSKRAREPREVELPADLVCQAAPPDEAAVLNNERRLLGESILRLPVAQREAIVLCISGFSYGEMAIILGISTNAAMLRCQRARDGLRLAVGSLS
jgi:RNA polymerase sigma-70 factor (ECF subfamily)